MGRRADYSFYQRLSFLFCDYCEEMRIVSRFTVSVENCRSTAKCGIPSDARNAILSARFIQAHPYPVSTLAN